MQVDFGRLRNSGGSILAAPHCCGFHNGGRGHKSLDKVDETFSIILHLFQQHYIHFIQPFTSVSPAAAAAAWRG